MVEKLQALLDVLTEGGIRARRGYPTETYFRPERPVAAVYFQDFQGKTLTLAAQIFATQAADCEDSAYRALQLMKALGGYLSADACRYDRQMGLFSQQVRIQWELEQSHIGSELSYQVAINGVLLPYLTSLTATWELLEGAESGRYTRLWTLTLQELFPLDMELEDGSDAPFELRVIRENSTEIFDQCRWSSITRTETNKGIRQVRVATTAEDRIVM